ncbi:hypothetical protein D5018_03835 [Parashewanella curva]|uniref:Uncharacterized protein n=1 Tax=Parashewanella curva TaxID=2338552 RepID=A0A3L8Q330_9GAMM|nr:hypothetical protein [Parashewanella curva]RLV60982.1 hypothetical protein D5018_03835 [Parashewanella curva]
MDRDLNSNSVFDTEALKKLLEQDAFLLQQVNPDANRVRIKLIEALTLKCESWNAPRKILGLKIQLSNRAFFEAMELLTQMIKRPKHRILFDKWCYDRPPLLPVAYYRLTLSRLTGILMSFTSKRPLESYSADELLSPKQLFNRDHLFFRDELYLTKDIKRLQKLTGIAAYKRRAFVLLFGWLPLGLRARLGIR